MTSNCTFYILSRCTSNYLYEFNTERKSFKQRPPRPPLSRCSVFKYKDLLFICCGLIDDKISDTGLIYDIHKSTWTKRSISIGKAFCGACETNGKMYVFGGINEREETQKTCSFYDFESDRWELLPSMERDRGQPGVVYHNSSFYVMGGFSWYRSPVERLDPREGKWENVGEPNSGGCLSAVILKDNVHMINNYTGKYSQFCLRTLKPTPESQMPFDGKQWLAVMNGKLHILHYDGIDFYDEETRTWTNILKSTFTKCPFLLC